MRHIPQPISAALPMTVITGYLGSGKTTLINQLLANAGGQRITVLVNDFGEISLDAELIENQDGDIIALANGCMCCQIGGDLYRTIDRILSLRSKIDHLVVETSGVADPSKIGQIAAAEPELTQNGTLTLVDAINFKEVHDQVLLRDTLQRQLHKADLILFTKLDMDGGNDLVEMLETIQAIAPDCPIAADGMDAISKLLAKDGFKLSSKNSFLAQSLKTHSVPFDSWNWQGKAPLRREQLVRLLQRKDLEIYRCKGMVRFDNGWCGVINKVGNTISVSPMSAQIDLSILTIIGPKPDFSRNRFEAAWNEAGVVQHSRQHAEAAIDG